MRLCKIRPLLLMVCATCVPSINDVSSAVTPTTTASKFTKDPTKLRASLALPISDTVVSVQVPSQKLVIRTKNADKDPRIEPVSITVPTNEAELRSLAEKLAVKGQAKTLAVYLQKRIDGLTGTEKDQKRVRITLTSEAIGMVHFDSLADDYTKSHHVVAIHARELQRSKKQARGLLEQTAMFLTPQEQQQLRSKISAGENLNLESDLLPDFARRMARKFLVYRGPNCFHAALAFHGTSFSDSPFVNVKRENGYHAAMINYDELWRAIKANFYEVDPEKSALKYGDMLVFFDASNANDPINFRWIRHTATYLLGPYTFSKGSKSPDTPYTVKTVDEEWRTWSKYVKNLGLKVFRRSQKSVKKLPPKDLADWIY